jgi:hypothetical protein
MLVKWDGFLVDGLVTTFTNVVLFEVFGKTDFGGLVMVLGLGPDLFDAFLLEGLIHNKNYQSQLKFKPIISINN